MIDVILKYLDPNAKTKDFIKEMVVFLQKQEIPAATHLWTGPAMFRTIVQYLFHSSFKVYGLFHEHVG